MELIVLGASGGYPAAGGAASGYLVQHDGFSLALDFGTGALSNLQRYLPIERIDAIAISHEHMDHCIDLFPLYVARVFRPHRLPPLPPVHLVTPPGILERLARLEDEEGAQAMRETFDLLEVEPGSDTVIGPFRVRTRLLPHWVPNLGMRIEADGRTLVFTGDTGPSEEIESLANGSDLLLSEASWQDGEDAGRDPFHLTARQAGTHAARAGVGRLVLTHLWPTSDPDRTREQASESFDGELTLAVEGMRLDVRG